MSAPLYTCPKCSGTDFKQWKLPHPLILHWVLNPGLAFNEVVLGQRLPKLQLICRTCEGALMERSYVPCPTCRHIHWGRLWKRTRAFGNGRRISCPACGAAIPCLWNVFSLVILAVTSPLWVLPYRLYFRGRPVRPIYDLVDGVPPKPRAITRKTWILMGAGWGALMWVVMSLLPVLLPPDKERVSRMLIVGLPVWAFGGLTFGFLMWLFLGRRPQRGQWRTGRCTEWRPRNGFRRFESH
jgi:MFS family permease